MGPVDGQHPALVVAELGPALGDGGGLEVLSPFEGVPVEDRSVGQHVLAGTGGEAILVVARVLDEATVVAPRVAHHVAVFVESGAVLTEGRQETADGGGVVTR